MDRLAAARCCAHDATSIVILSSDGSLQERYSLPEERLVAARASTTIRYHVSLAPNHVFVCVFDWHSKRSKVVCFVAEL